jgi:hypothetical protein
MNNNNNNINNENRMDDVVVVHVIPIKASPGGLAPHVALDVYYGVVNDGTRDIFDQRFAAARSREAVEANDERRGVAIVKED